MTTLLQTGLRLLSNLRQHNRLLRLSFPNGDGPASVLVVNRLDAREALSRDFRFEVELLSDSENIALKDVQGKMVTVELVREDGSVRYFNGYVFEFRRDSTDGALAYYTMVLGPWMAYLRLRRDNYIFHNRTLSQQADEIFADYPVRAVKMHINGADPRMTYACQYAESDYNYLHRRWEAQGWYYWYEHGPDGHTLVLSDDSTTAPPIDGARVDIPFHRAAGSGESDGLVSWSAVRRLVPASVALSGFDFKKPRPAFVDVPTLNEQGDVLHIESYDYAGAYGFVDRQDGGAQARMRMEEIEADSKWFAGDGNDRTVQPGRKFVLTKPYDAFEENDLDFLILEAHHEASNNYQDGDKGVSSYTNRIACSRTKVPWRPGRGYNSTEPRIYGLQTAIVVGPAGEEIFTDEFGRVRVQFHWDRAGENNDKSSAWIRVSTPWSGANFGMTSIPRIGTEVIVQFLDGNPDRPLITGMVPNAATMPPWTLPANKTQSGILTRSTPGGSYDNANAIRFEDLKGQEQLWFHAEKDQLTEVEHDEDKWVGNDRRKTIDRDETSHIKRNRTERVDHDERISIGDNRTEDVGKNETIDIGANRSKTVGENEMIDVGMNKTETIGMASLQNVGLGRMDNVGLGYDLNVGMVMATIVGVDQITKVGNAISITAGSELSITVGQASLLMKADGTIVINGHSFSVGTTGEQTYDAAGDIKQTGKNILQNS